MCRHALLALCCWCAAGLALSQATVPEFQLKAAFLFNFAIFTDWPPEALATGAPLQLCSRQGNALQHALQALHDKYVNGHPLALRQLDSVGTADSVRSCHILFLDRQDRDRWPRLRKELAGASVLTVTDDVAIGADGVVLALAMDEHRVVFDADLGAARQARLTLSSKLLRLARSMQ
jgi:hypothetical protein